jgi:integrase
MYVTQIKTATKIWVPLPKPLRDYLADWPKRGPFIVMSPKGRGKPTPWRETSITNQFIKATKALGFETTDSKGEPRFYSPHGLRHLCGVELSLAGATAEQIAAVLGHASVRQTETYIRQAEQRVLARSGSGTKCMSASGGRRRSTPLTMWRGLSRRARPARTERESDCKNRL